MFKAAFEKLIGAFRARPENPWPLYVPDENGCLYEVATRKEYNTEWDRYFNSMRHTSPVTYPPLER